MTKNRIKFGNLEIEPIKSLTLGIFVFFQQNTEKSVYELVLRILCRFGKVYKDGLHIEDENEAYDSLLSQEMTKDDNKKLTELINSVTGILNQKKS